jgi:hypothetical protein
MLECNSTYCLCVFLCVWVDTFQTKHKKTVSKQASKQAIYFENGRSSLDDRHPLSKMGKERKKISISIVEVVLVG